MRKNSKMDFPSFCVFQCWDFLKFAFGDEGLVSAQFQEGGCDQESPRGLRMEDLMKVAKLMPGLSCASFKLVAYI